MTEHENCQKHAEPDSYVINTGQQSLFIQQ